MEAQSAQFPLSVKEQLLQQVAKIDAQLDELSRERDILIRIINNIRENEKALEENIRKNSSRRIIIENIILEIITHKKNIRTRDMFEIARLSFAGLKENTFRSYLHRLSKKGAIEISARNGMWRLCPTKEIPT